MAFEFQDLVINRRRDAQLQEQARAAQFRLQHPLVPVVLCNLAGEFEDANGDPVDARVEGDEIRVWARELAESQPAPYLNLRGVPALGGMPCWAGYAEESQEREILGVNAANALVQREQLRDRHAREHEPGGYDPLHVYLRSIVPLRLTPLAGLVVQVAPLIYDNGGTLVTYSGTNSLSLAASVPAAGLARYALVYLDPADNTVKLSNGSTVTDGAFVPPLPTPANSAYPSAWVRLAGGQTAISEIRDIVDARLLLVAFGGGPHPFPAWGQVILLRSDGTFSVYTDPVAAVDAAVAGDIVIGLGIFDIGTDEINIDVAISFGGVTGNPLDFQITGSDDAGNGVILVGVTGEVTLHDFQVTNTLTTASGDSDAIKIQSSDNVYLYNVRALTASGGSLSEATGIEISQSTVVLDRCYLEAPAGSDRRGLYVAGLINQPSTVTIRGGTYTGQANQGIVTSTSAQATAGENLPMTTGTTGSGVAGFFVDENGNIFNVGGTLDLNGIADGLILDADGDTTISSPTDDQIDLEVGGSDIIQITAALGLNVRGNKITLDADSDTYLQAATDDNVAFSIAAGNNFVNITTAGIIISGASQVIKGFSSNFPDIGDSSTGAMGDGYFNSAIFAKQIFRARASALADDTAVQLNSGLPFGNRFNFMINANNGSYFWGVDQFNSVATVANSGFSVVAGGGTLTGTDGPDGTINIRDNAGDLYLENRTGGNINYGYVYFGSD